MMINLWAMVVAGIVSLGIGWAWYSETLFGKMWRGYMGVTDAQMEEAKKKGMGGMVWQFAITLVGLIVMAYVLGYFLVLAGAATFGQGLMVAFWAWLGFIAVSHLSGVTFERKPQGYFWLNTLYYLVVLFVQSAILIWMK